MPRLARAADILAAVLAIVGTFAMSTSGMAFQIGFIHLSINRARSSVQPPPATASPETNPARTILPSADDFSTMKTAYMGTGTAHRSPPKPSSGLRF